MKLASDWERGLVIQFATWFIKQHDLKLEDQSTPALAAEFAAEMCEQVDCAINVEAPSREEVERWVREEISDLQMEEWDQLGRPL
ncbi:hypothetical protein CWO91_26670 [Bradyrhizobium genosp. SA-3]|uniref:hypothetical protein n=1 Tax=Bradyrhizobium genosp. SA-3 TaxID=508868 RepID=UPI001029043F|nr:hypothetical protein [Bradyrhizobium genosp. SA-3]RZN07585.1 hypothetical protein CWO91_26670 [Bradyrhizobium genosp. SA-3]